MNDNHEQTTDDESLGNPVDGSGAGDGAVAHPRTDAASGSDHSATGAGGPAADGHEDEREEQAEVYQTPESGSGEPAVGGTDGTTDGA